MNTLRSGLIPRFQSRFGGSEAAAILEAEAESEP